MQAAQSGARKQVSCTCLDPVCQTESLSGLQPAADTKGFRELLPARRGLCHLEH